MKGELIRNYISTIDFRTEWDHNIIREDLKRILGEEPAIDVKWKRDVRINELRGKSEVFMEPETLDVIFTDVDDKIKKLSFKI